VSARDALRDALRAYVETGEHRVECAAHNEGQRCCLDPDHPEFGQLLDAILAAVTKVPPYSGEGLVSAAEAGLVAARLLAMYGSCQFCGAPRNMQAVQRGEARVMVLGCPACGREAP
jgi:hypothetical protein